MTIASSSASSSGVSFPTMPRLYHFALDPYGRRLRLALAEYAIDAQLVDEKPWAPSAQLLQFNPAGLSPVFVEDGGIAVVSPDAIAEYLEETQSSNRKLIPGNATARAEVRRLVNWFDVKFYTEVTEPILSEKVISRFVAMQGSTGSPNMGRVRSARQLLSGHLDYIGALAEERSFLAGDELSNADLAAAAHISAIDYLGDVPWTEHPVAQTWYMRIKSRPSFKVLLGDTIAGVPASSHYSNLDF
jgi:glutathione S-transferase